MNTFRRLLPALLICTVTQSFAADPPANAVTPSKPASPPAAATTTAKATDASTTHARPKRIVLEDKTLTNEEVRQLFAQGYKPIGRNGMVYYCRRETEVGSHISKMMCRTAEQMKEITQASKNLLETKQRSAAGCGMTGC